MYVGFRNTAQLCERDRGGVTSHEFSTESLSNNISASQFMQVLYSTKHTLQAEETHLQP